MRLEIDGAHAGIKFSATHFIAGHEKCGRLHGHVYILSLIVHGDLGQNGMVMDFIPLKKALREIAEELDHRVILPGDSKHITIKLGDEIEVKAKGKRYIFPAEDVVILDIVESSAEEIAAAVLSMLTSRLQFPSNVRCLEIGLHEELGQSAWVQKELR
jgi:6-pyruvoyltetrahydropterin/6-carboxytetrahydropterin synthase